MPPSLTLFADRNAVEELRERLCCDWPNLKAARDLAISKRNELEGKLEAFQSADTSIVVFGSLARDEFTSGSDMDWTLLVDGIADPGHLKAAQGITRRLQEIGVEAPGREGTFGRLAFSHDIIHQIGGQDDTNVNTTRRILLLLESKPIGRTDAYERVVSNVLDRYLTEDWGLWHGSSRYKVPRFLLNDFARYWRTMAVDFAYKQRERSNEGWALRKTKLRLSRKLIFVTGLLACFSCHRGLSESERANIYDGRNTQGVTARLRKLFKQTPLEILASTLLDYEQFYPSARKLFDAYDTFLGILGDESTLSDGKTPRDHLDELPLDDLDNDDLYQSVRRITHEFRDALTKVFLTPGSDLYEMTIAYGVF